MKSICAHLGAAPRTIALRELNLEPKEDQVLVRVTACGICRGDIIEFGQPRERAHSATKRWGRSLPADPGSGPEGNDWVVGSIWPGFATFALAPEGVYSSAAGSRRQGPDGAAQA